MKSVLSIDIGMKNFCYCLYSLSSGRILRWERLELPPKGKELLIPRLVSFVHQFKEQNEDMSRDASIVAIEQQIAASMRIMEAVLHSQFVGRAQSVNPRQVKRHFRALFPELVPEHRTGKKSRSIDYALGKRLAVAVTKELLEREQDVRWAEFFANEKKKDDFADCFLQAKFVEAKLDKA